MHSRAYACAIHFLSAATDRAVSSGGIEAVTAALKMHSSNGPVLEYSSRALVCLCWSGMKTKQAAKAAGAPGIIAAAAPKFSEDAAVAEWTAKALEKIGAA
jgi:hypothetical protein